jgi:hypothetical protein
MAHGTARNTHRRTLGRILLMLMLGIGILSLQPQRSTLAYFTAGATSANNAFTAGSVALKLTDADETSLTSITGSIGATAFKPGDTTVGYVTVENSGTLPFDYGLHYTATNTTGTLWVGGATNPTLQVYAAGATSNCTIANAIGAKTGLTSAFASASVSLTPSSTIFDSAGGSKRTLAAGAQEVLCLTVAWANGAAGAENAQQGAVGKIDLTFDAR